MQVSYSASPSTADLSETFYTLKKMTPDAGSSSLADLSADNYPDDRIPLTDAYGCSVPNPANQVIFKNQPVSWWIAGITAGSIVYTPVSNTVNWSYTNGGNLYHIIIEISNLIIPDRTESVTHNPKTWDVTVILEDNQVLNLMQKYRKA
jgi:hypothetical protein